MSFIQDIKEMIAGFAAWFKKIKKDIPNWVKRAIPPILQITKGIKAALQSDAAFVLVSLIPGDWDNKFRDEMIVFLDKATKELLGIDECNGDIDCIGEKLMQHLRSQPSEAMQDAALLKLASLVLSVKDQKRLKSWQYDTLTQNAAMAELKTV